MANAPKYLGLFDSPTPAVELSIIIVNWHSADYVMACVQSIYEQTSSVRFEVIVVDNASFDGCGERIAREHPDITFLQSHANLGFAGANNLAVGYAHGGVFLFLNPDTEVMDRAIERLYLRFLTLPDVGVVGSRLLNSDGSLQTSCVQPLPTILNQAFDAEILKRLFPKAGLWRTTALFESGASPVEVEAVSGACIMIRQEVFDRVGGFSSDYFMYGEDMDLCCKTRGAGFSNYYVGDAVIVHHGGGSSKQNRNTLPSVMLRESAWRYFYKNHGRPYAVGYRLTVIVTAAARIGALILALPLFLLWRRSCVWKECCLKWLSILQWAWGGSRLARGTR